MKLYEENGLNKLDFYDEKRIIEHLKIAAIAYKDRDRYIADPKFMDADPVELLKKTHVLESVKLDIEGDTTFLAAADKEGIEAKGFNKKNSCKLVSVKPINDNLYLLEV